MPMLTLVYQRCLECLSGAYRGAFEGALRSMVIVVLGMILGLVKGLKYRDIRGC